MPTGDDRRRDALVRAPVRRLQRHLNRGVWLQALVAPLWAAVSAFAFWRFLIRVQPELIGVLLLTAACVAWVLRARKGRISDAEAAVRADCLSDVKGLLLTRLEVAVGQWELDLNAKVRAMKLPPQALRRPLSLTALAVVFLAAVLLVPAPPPRTVAPKNAAAANKLAEVEARAEALAKEEPLEGSIEAELARLREELDENRFDAADWEAADGLDGNIAQKAAEAAEELRKAEEAAAALEESMAKAGEGEASAREQESLEKALMELSDGASESGEDALEKALEQSGDQQSGEGETSGEKSGEKSGEQSGEKSGDQSGEKSGEKSGQQSGKRGVSRSQLSELQKALSQRQQQLQKSFGEQQRGQQQSASKQQGQGRGQGQKGDGQGEGQGQGEGEGEANGQRGGPSRGGGEGALSFDDQSEVHPERLAFEPMPKGQGGNPDELWGLRGVNPKSGSEGAKSGDGSGDGSAAIGEQSPAKRHEQMLPRNRDLVRRYFGGE